MKINFLQILLVLVALQSTIAVADLHQVHQLNGEHLKFVQLDDNTTDELKISKQNTNQSESKAIYDCQHCCHCHGVACYYLDKDKDSCFSIDVSSTFNGKNFTFYTHYSTPDLRPPIV